MLQRRNLHRWIASLIMLLLIRPGENRASDTPSHASSKAYPKAETERSNPNIGGVNPAKRLTDEMADSLEKRFRSPQVDSGQWPESENVLRRQVKKVVVDETKIWRDMVEGAVQAYEKSAKPEDKLAAESTLIGIVQNPEASVDIQRECMKHLAQFALDARSYSKAQQIYSQLVSRFPLHPDTPSILYRQGVLYRRIGATELALSKFHAVMSTVISLQEKEISTYQTLVLLAQTEIADTFFVAGQFDRAAEYYRRVLKLANNELNEEQIRLKLVKSVFELKDWKGVIAEGQQTIEKVPLSGHVAEVRFLMAEAYKKLGMRSEAIRQTMELLNTEEERAAKDPENWAYWQKRTGNQLANELYEQGDYVNALLIYETLAKLPGTEEWHSQALYQIGLIYERMFQPERATAAYTEILARSTNAITTSTQPEGSSTNNKTNSPAERPTARSAMESSRSKAANQATPKSSPGLNLIREMAQWRLNHLNWDQTISRETRKLFFSSAPSSTNGVQGSSNPIP
jgi:tetratricopeptide (TPR) repeat protein